MHTRIARIISPAALSAIIMSCTVMTDDMADRPEDTGMNLVDISISATSGEGSKAALGEKNTVLWSEGDQIFMVNKSGESYEDPLDIVSGAGTADATFEGTVNYCSAGWYGVYPPGYGDDHGLDSDGNLTVGWYGNSQQALDGGISPEHLVMVGQSEESDGGLCVKFRNLLAYIKFTLDFDCSEVTITPNDDTVLACSQLTVAFDENGIPAVTDWALNRAGDHEVHLKSSSGTILHGTYCLAVIPQILENGFTMTFKVEDGENVKTYHKSTSQTVELKRSTILNIGEFDTASINSDDNFDGEGTPENPYLITSYAQLDALSDLVFLESDGHYASACYRQDRDIDCGGKKLSAIGFWAASITSKYFSGTYDGGGYKIFNYVPSPVKSSCGLFGGVSNAVLKNIVLEPNNYTKNFKSAQYGFYGILAGYATGTLNIENCKVIGNSSMTFNVNDDISAFASMVAYCSADLTMTGCENSVSLTAQETGNHATHEPVVVGGLVGHVFAGYDDDTKRKIVIDRCRNTGDIMTGSNNESYAGGIVGRAFEESDTGDVALMITNCINTGAVTAITADTSKDTAAGGIVGSNRSNGFDSTTPFLYNCLNTGEVLSIGDDGYGGGIMGFVYSGDTVFYCCVNTGKVTAEISGYDLSAYDPYLGAICGDNYSWTLNPGYYYYCHWTNDSTMPIVYDEPNYSKATDCSYKDIVTGDFMNTLLIKIPNSDYLYARWTGSSEDKSLDINL